VELYTYFNSRKKLEVKGGTGTGVPCSANWNYTGEERRGGESSHIHSDKWQMNDYRQVALGKRASRKFDQGEIKRDSAESQTLREPRTKTFADAGAKTKTGMQSTLDENGKET